MPKEALIDWLRKATRESSEASPNPRRDKKEKTSSNQEQADIKSQ